MTSTAATTSQPPTDRQQADVTTWARGLGGAAAAARGRLPDDVVEDAGRAAERAGDRLRLSAEHTIVALAGATGSGKSSLFNNLTGLDLAAVGVRRPTTSWALACAWGPDGAGDILEWMGVAPRHQVSRMSMLDQSPDDQNLQGLVLLDLPDHDSTEVSHHLEVDRLVNHADLLVWVMDPQKYADAALHERYLRPLAGHGDVTMVVLNQIDRIAPEQRAAALADVRRLLVEDGLPDVPLLGVSALDGAGLDDLRRALAARVQDKQAARGRVGIDVRGAAERVAGAGGTTPPPELAGSDRDALMNSLATCAGVPALTEAIQRSTVDRAARATSWPPVRWIRGRGGRGGRGKDTDGTPRPGPAALAVPAPTPVARARVDGAVRDLTDHATAGLALAWARAVRAAAGSGEGDLVDDLDTTLTHTDLGIARPALWWRLVHLVQWLLLAAAALGLGWLAYVAVTDLVGGDQPATPVLLGVPAPTSLLVGGIVLGVALDLASRVAARGSARRKADRADQLLRSSIAEIADRWVVRPVSAELDRYREYRSGVLIALGTLAHHG